MKEQYKQPKSFNIKSISSLENRELFVELEKVIEAYVKLQMTKKGKYNFKYPIERIFTVLGYDRFKKYKENEGLIKYLTSLIEESKVISNEKEIPVSYFKTVIFNYLSNTK